MARRVICGAACLVSALAGLLAGAATGAGSGMTCAPARHVGAVTAVGCWHRVGSGWRAPVPVKLNGMTLAGAGFLKVDERRGTIRSTRSVRWRFGDIQIRKSAFAWKRGTTIPIAPSGRLRGLDFRGSGAITFTRTNGGTTRLAAHVSVPLVAGGLSGDAVVTVNRKTGFDVKRLHVKVPQVPFSRLVFDKLDFGYDVRDNRWSGSGAASLPAFLKTNVTVAGRVEVANGKLAGVAVGADGLNIPLADGFVLTGAALTVGLDPFGLAGSATATFGPPLGPAAAMRLEGRGAYDSQPTQWRVNGSVKLPWLPVFTPSISGAVVLHPGRAMTFEAEADLTVHHWGVKADLEGFVSRKAFNAEGEATLDVPGPNLSGSGLFSSKGMAACGKVFFGARVGFGYSWGSAIDFMHSSCDVGRWRVQQRALRALSSSLRLAGPLSAVVPAGLPFEVFAVRGADFTVTGPAGTVASTPDRDGPDAYVTHDPDDAWAYVVLPVPPGGTYSVTPLGTGTIAELDLADGLVDPTITGSVSGTGDRRTLQYEIRLLAPGETVSFYQGQSGATAGAEPIVEDVAANGTGSADFDLEPLGQSARYVFAVVSIDGRPRLQQQVASFDAREVPPSATVVRIFASGEKGWIVNYAKSDRVERWQALVQWTTSQGQYRTSQTIESASPYQTIFPASYKRLSVKGVVVTMVPYDEFGRPGTAILCDSAKPGICPVAPPSATATIP